MPKVFRKLMLLLIVINATTLAAQNYTKSIAKLKAGDILFQQLNCGELCNAINAVTNGYRGKDYNHCALVVTTSSGLQVIEAIGSKVQYNSIRNFYARTNDTVKVKNILVARPKQKYQTLIPAAQAEAMELVGQPYDDVFIINNGAWYCSELIYHVFKVANNNTPIFLLKPMTYKNPKTNEFFPAWVTYYAQLKQPIPQGYEGINPGGISRSKVIKIIK